VSLFLIATFLREAASRRGVHILAAHTASDGGAMHGEFVRTGELKDLASYPGWLQDIVEDTAAAKARVVQHDVFQLMRDAELPLEALRRFLIGVWPTIELFPQFMAKNLTKVRNGRSRGEDMARRYLMQNLRVEQKHADYWVDWAAAAGLTRDDLRRGDAPSPMHALAHWCWHTCDSDPLPVAIAATNYAVEGATGEWACLVCAVDTYERSLPEATRKAAMKWLRVHAHYDDTHPWEALEIVATLLGCAPAAAAIDAVHAAVLKSYEYMELTLDWCLRPRPPLAAPRRRTVREAAATLAAV
jgi:pyrroloquinoline quinone (PQQ) biosynthesis protein C